MAIPNVSITPAQIQPRENVPVTGTDFDRVAGVFLYDASDQTYMETSGFQIDDGQHLHFTVRPDTPMGTYTVVLVDLDDEDGTSTAPPLQVVPLVSPPQPVVVSSTVPPDLIARLRLEMQDNPSSFQTVATGTGDTTRYELDEHPIEPTTLMVGIKEGTGQLQALSASSDYSLDPQAGVLTLNQPVPDLATLVVSGTNYRYFIDSEYATFIDSAFQQHALGRDVVDHTIDPVTGFKRYINNPFTYAAMPAVEVLPLVIQAKIQALWVLATDASTDIDVSEDGASIPVSERYRQIMQQISAETVRYNDIAQKLNLGLGSIEMFTLRRVSRTTGRLVPIYVEKEYDDWSAPLRVYPPINQGTLGGSEAVDPYYSAIGP